MPRRVVAPVYGPPSVVEVVEVPSREPGEGRVVIVVRAAGVNPADAKSIAGMWGSDPEKLPLPVGSEIAGVIAAIGEGVSGIAVGDEVVAFRVVGGFADEVVAVADNVFPKPPSASFDEAAGLLLTGTTAWHLLEATGVAAGDRVIVHGASGSVGRLVVQLAVARGASVVGTASERNQDAVAALGATPVVYGDGLADRLRDLLPEGADVALDTVGTDEALDVSVALVADRDRIATIAGFARGAELGIRLLGGGPGADPGSAVRNAARAPLLALLEEGALTVEMAATFPLTEAAEALDHVMKGHAGGKVILRP